MTYIIELWLKLCGWKMYDYPFPRGHYGYQLTLYHKPEFGMGNWTISSAINLELGLMEYDKPEPLR